MTPIEDWIKWYRKQEINVIPLREREKVPLMAWDEFKRRTTNNRELEKWKSRGIKNFGAVCGRISNHLLVIDVDKEELFSELNFGELANKTFTVRTAKGYHIYLRMHDPQKKSLIWGGREEIRFQGEGKYVVCAGSQHPDGWIYKQLSSSPRKIKKADPQLLNELKQRWKRYHNIDKIEEKREEVKLKTKRTVPLENFKTRASLSSVVRQYVSKAKDYGTYWQGHCPFHEDHHPSFTVYEDTNSYYCFGCERYGDVISFIEEKESKGFVDAVKRIEEITGVKYYKKGIEEEKKREIYPYEVEEIIRAERDFITLRDTEEVLHYENSAGGAWRFDGEALIKKETEKILKNWERAEKASRYFASEVIGHVQRSTYIERERLNTEEKKINLLNGVYDLETDQLLPHDASYYFTYLIPVQYNEKLDCPRIKKFLGEILYEDDIQTVLQFIGYCMLPIMPYHRALMFLGDGANGKSTLIELIRHFLGEKNTCSHSLQSIIERRFTAADMYGRLGNLYADIPKEALRHTGKFKILTGGDTLSVEKKFKEPFSFKNTTKMIFSANILPMSMDDTTAFFRRWLIITFPNKFEGKRCDTEILKKLTTQKELSGLLNLVLEALKQLLRDDKFSKSKPAEEIREEYIDKSNPVQSFVTKRLEADINSFETKEDVYLAFIDFCRERKLPDVSKQKFGGLLSRYIQVREEKKRISGSRVRCWQGIHLVKAGEIERAEQSVKEQIAPSARGDVREDEDDKVERELLKVERKDEREYPLVEEPSEETKTDSSEGEAGQEASSTYSPFIQIKREVLDALMPNGTEVDLEELIDEVHRRRGYSVERVSACIDRLVKGKWIKRDGRFVSSLIDSYPA